MAKNPERELSYEENEPEVRAAKEERKLDKRIDKKKQNMAIKAKIARTKNK